MFSKSGVGFYTGAKPDKKISESFRKYYMNEIDSHSSIKLKKWSFRTELMSYLVDFSD